MGGKVVTPRLSEKRRKPGELHNPRGERKKWIKEKKSDHSHPHHSRGRRGGKVVNVRPRGKGKGGSFLFHPRGKRRQSLPALARKKYFTDGGGEEKGDRANIRLKGREKEILSHFSIFRGKKGRDVPKPNPKKVKIPPFCWIEKTRFLGGGGKREVLLTKENLRQHPQTRKRSANAKNSAPTQDDGKEEGNGFQEDEEKITAEKPSLT